MKASKKGLSGVSRFAITFVLLSVLTITAGFARSVNKINVNAASANSGNTLSLVEINDSFGTLLMRSSQHKTIVYVERLYFDYNILSSLRLKELDCVINITNASGEWAKVGGWIKSEQLTRPNDLSGKVQTVYYLEVQQYWEWRTFTNNESWKVTVFDGYTTCELDFTKGKDGTIYHIDGAYGLPNTEYRQVAYWCDLNNSNIDLVDSVTEYAKAAAEEAKNVPENKVLNLKPLKFKGEFTNNRVMSSNTDASAKTPLNNTDGSISASSDTKNFIIGGIIIGVCVITALVCTTVAICKVTSASVPQVVPPGLGNNTIPPEVKKEYEDNKPELTEPERAELDKYKEFSLDNDAPTGQKIVKLKVLDEDGVQQSCYDENGNELWVNRKTYTVGNSTFALIDRKAWLLIKYNPDTMQLTNTAGDKITVNADNKIMNMDGVQCLSPISVDDVLKKLADMGTYTSSMDYTKLLFRMDDDNTLKTAMGETSRDTKVGFWGTIKNAINNIFGSGNSSSSSQNFLSTFLDVLIIIVIALLLALGLYIAVRFILGLIKSTR